MNIEKYKALVAETGRARRKIFGKSFSQADFIAGAMCAFALLEKMEAVPPIWILGTMTGEDVFAKEEK